MNLDYIAGFFDGEGSASILVRETPAAMWGWLFRPRLSIANNRVVVLEAICKTLGYGHVGKATQARPHVYAWYTTKHSDLSDFVSKMKERVLIKREQLHIMEESLQYLHPYLHRHWRTHFDRDTALKLLDCAARMREANRAGGKVMSKIDLEAVRQSILRIPSERLTQRESKRMEKLRMFWTARLESVPKEVLEQMYVESRLPVEEIRIRLKLSESMFYRRLRHYKIPFRRARRLSDASLETPSAFESMQTPTH